MKQPLILALDIGTSSVRASLYDEFATARPRYAAKVAQSFVMATDGTSEIDADAAFANVIAAIDAVLRKTSKLRTPIGYVASSAFWHTLVGIDENAKPTTSVIGWADTRSREYSGLLREKFNESNVHNRTGARFHSSYWPAKLLWLRREFPDVFRKTDRWLSFSDLVALRLLGDATTSVSMASATGIFDIRQCRWDTELVRFLKIKPTNLADVSSNDSATFALNKKYAKRWRQLADAKWLPAIGDGAADSIGAGCVTKKRAALMIGTSGAMRVAFKGDPPERIPTGLWCYRLDRKRVIIGGALSDGGGLYRWLKKNLLLPKDAEEQISKRPPGARGLSFLPFLSGERSTGYHENAAGAILSLTSGHDPVDILQAAMESVAFRFADIFDQLNKIGKIKEIVSSGGALRESPVWTQIIADVLGHDLIMNAAKESSSRGAVLHALESVRKIGDIKIHFKADEQLIFRNRIRSDVYQKARKRHADFYQLLIK